MKKKKDSKSNNSDKRNPGRGAKSVFLSYDEFFYSEKFKEDLRNAKILK